MISVADTDGKTTTVSVIAEPGTALFDLGIIGQGQARCRPDDVFSPGTGELIALGRAMIDFGAKVEAVGNEAVVTKDELARVAAVMIEAMLP